MLTSDDLTPMLMNFVIVMVGSVRENAEAQSTEAAMTALIPGLSRRERTLSTMATIRCSVPTPF